MVVVREVEVEVEEEEEKAGEVETKPPNSHPHPPMCFHNLLIGSIYENPKMR